MHVTSQAEYGLVLHRHWLRHLVLFVFLIDILCTDQRHCESLRHAGRLRGSTVHFCHQLFLSVGPFKWSSFGFFLYHIPVFVFPLFYYYYSLEFDSLWFLTEENIWWMSVSLRLNCFNRPVQAVCVWASVWARLWASVCVRACESACVRFFSLLCSVVVFKMWTEPYSTARK